MWRNHHVVDDRWFQIRAPHMCATGDLSDAGIVTDTAPILKYMKGWRLDKVREYCAKKGWIIHTFTGTWPDQ